MFSLLEQHIISSGLIAGLVFVLAGTLPHGCHGNQGSVAKRGSGRTCVGVNVDNNPPGSKRLFVDDFFIESRSGVTRTLHTAKKYAHNPILPAKGDDYAKWEHADRLAFYMSAAFDPVDRRFKLWYETHMPGHSDMLGLKASYSSFAFADSVDGFNFTRRTDLGMSYSKVPGLLDESDRPITGPDIPTNIVMAKAHGFTAFIDPTVANNARDRFKAAWGPEGIEAGGTTSIGFSADGTHWIPYNDGVPVIGRASDTVNQILWDPRSQQYLLVNREDLAGDDSEVEVRGTRIVGRINSSDSSRELLARPAAWLDDKENSFLELAREGLTEEGYPREWRDRQIHATTIWPYEGVYFALLSVMEGKLDQIPNEGPAESVRHEHNIVNFYIATSRDLRTWNYDWVYARRPTIERGANGEFDKDGIHAVTIVTEGGRHLFYYCGMYERFALAGVEKIPLMRIGVAELRLDGFVSLDAGDEEGVITTVPIKLQGDRLAINIDAHVGSLLIEILDKDGNPIPGFTAAEADHLAGVDNVSATASWRGKSSLSALSGQHVKLRFRLRRASLYSFQDVII